MDIFDWMLPYVSHINVDEIPDAVMICGIFFSMAAVVLTSSFGGKKR